MSRAIARCRATWWALTLVVSIWPSVARAESVAVLPASGSGVSTAIIQATRALLVRRLAEMSPRLRVVDIDRPPTAEPPPDNVALAWGLSVRAESVLTMRVERQAPTTTLLVTGLEVATGQRMFELQQSTAAGPETLPPLVEMIVQTMVARARGAVAITGGVAYAPPPPPPPKDEGGFGLGMRGGALRPFGTAGDVPSVLGGAGIFLLRDGRWYLADLGLDFARNEEAHRTGFGVGLYLPFATDGDSTYLGAALRWVDLHLGGQGAAGFSGMPALGYVWRRARPGERGRQIGIRLEAGYQFDFFSERSEDRLIPGSGLLHRAHGPQLMLGIWL